MMVLQMIIILIGILSIFPPTCLSVSYANTTTSCNLRFNLQRYSSVRLRWIPPIHKGCGIEVSASSDLRLNVMFYSPDSSYEFSPACEVLQPLLWQCATGCVGLKYTQRLGNSPEPVYSISTMKNLKPSYLRLLYCSSDYVPYFSIVTTEPEETSDGTIDPVMRILGPVLATVCIMAAVFIVCVCYAQNFYQRDATCCPQFQARIRRRCPCLPGGRGPGNVASGGNATRQSNGSDNPGHDSGVTSDVPSRFMPPHIAAQELRRIQDQPPPYDDFHKYHRRGSFVLSDVSSTMGDIPMEPLPSPPSYTAALESLGSDGNGNTLPARQAVDNPAFDLGTLEVLTEVPERNLSADVGVVNPTFTIDSEVEIRQPPSRNPRPATPTAVELEIDLADGSQARVERRSSHSTSADRGSNC